MEIGHDTAAHALSDHVQHAVMPRSLDRVKRDRVYTYRYRHMRTKGHPSCGREWPSTR